MIEVKHVTLYVGANGEEYTSRRYAALSFVRNILSTHGVAALDDPKFIEAISLLRESVESVESPKVKTMHTSVEYVVEHSTPTDAALVKSAMTAGLPHLVVYLKGGILTVMGVFFHSYAAMRHANDLALKGGTTDFIVVTLTQDE